MRSRRVASPAPVGGDQSAGLEIAGDGVLRDPMPHRRLGLLGQLPEQARALGPERLLELGHVDPLSGEHLAAVASGRARADPRRLQQHDVVAALGQVQRRRDAREAAADHAHVGIDRAGERRMRGHRVGRGGVVGFGMPGGQHVAFRLFVAAHQVQIRPAAAVNRARRPVSGPCAMESDVW